MTRMRSRWSAPAGVPHSANDNDWHVSWRAAQLLSERRLRRAVGARGAEGADGDGVSKARGPAAKGITSSVSLSSRQAINCNLHAAPICAGAIIARRGPGTASGPQHTQVRLLQRPRARCRRWRAIIFYRAGAGRAQCIVVLSRRRLSRRWACFMRFKRLLFEANDDAGGGSETIA